MRPHRIALCITLVAVAGCPLPLFTGPRLFFINADGAIAAYQPGTEQVTVVVPRDRVFGRAHALDWLSTGQLRATLNLGEQNFWVGARFDGRTSAAPAENFAFDAEVNEVCVEGTDAIVRCVPFGGGQSTERPDVAVIRRLANESLSRAYLIDRGGLVHRLPFLIGSYVWEPSAGIVEPAEQAHPLRGTWTGMVTKTDLETDTAESVPFQMAFTDEGYLYAVHHSEVGGMLGDLKERRDSGNTSREQTRTETETADYRSDGATVRIVYERQLSANWGAETDRVERDFEVSLQGDQLLLSGQRLEYTFRNTSSEQEDSLTVYTLEGPLERVVP